MKKVATICATVLVAGVWACSVNLGGSSEDNASAAAGLAGTYVTAAHGNSLDKDWSYSGALVLDSTRHFGISLRVAVDSDAPETTSLHGTYQISKMTRRRHGRIIRTTKLTLAPEGERHSDRPVLLMSGDTLKYAGPWWFNAGLGVLGIGDPVLVRESGVTAPALSGAQLSGAGKAASSTPVSSRKSSVTQETQKRSPAKLPAVK
jgi:hypothetical protein